MNLPRLARLAALAALALSCSPANVIGSDIDGACQDYAYHYCTYLEGCSHTALLLRYGTIDFCKSLFKQGCSTGASLPSSGVTAASVEAYVSALPSWSCDDFVLNQNPPPACQPWTGGLADGAACGATSQCQSGYCGVPTGSGCGTCTPPQQPGDSCAITQCPLALHCQNSVCVAYAQQGESCTTAPCADGLNCANGKCAIGMKGSGTCDYAGAGCDYYGGFVCNGLNSMCETLTLAQPGQACGIVAGQKQDCAAGTCVRGACVANPTTGQACQIGVTGAPACGAYSLCVASADGGKTGTCQIRGSLACP